MIDLLAVHPHYRAHVDPVWNALPAAVRGAVIDRSARKGPQPNAVLLVSGADVRRARDLGYSRIALLEHGIGQSYHGGRSPSYPGAPGRDRVSLFLSPNATASAHDRAAYPGARHAIVGDPVVDYLPIKQVQAAGVKQQTGHHDRPRADDEDLTGEAEAPKEHAQNSEAEEQDPKHQELDDSGHGQSLRGAGPVIAISFHWSWDGIPEMRSAFEHYRSVLPELAAAFPGLIGHAHPRAAGAMERHYRKAGIPFVADFADVCRRADVYVNDQVSTLYEFASTGRPVVVLNAPWYRREVQQGLRFWSAAHVGIQVDEPEDLVQAIQDALSDPPAQQAAREAALDLVYQPRAGAAVRAVAAILDWLDERQAIAA